MANRRVFTRNKNYFGLEEAIHDIINQYSDDDAAFDVVMLPPDPAVITDEEEGGDDDLYGNQIPRDVPGNIEVVTKKNASTVEEQWSSDDDEPLATFASSTSRNVSKRIRVETGAELPTWRKCKPLYSVFQSTPDQTFVEERRANVLDILKDMTPVKIFELLIDDEVLELIASESTIYAGQNNRHDTIFTKEELRKFLGILIFTGYHKLPSERSYWSVDEDLGVALVSDCMSRNRFLEIKRNLHFADNSMATSSTDKMFKIRPLCDILQNKFCQFGMLHENLSIDESMVKYFGHHSAKQFIMGKPVRYGYRNWALTSFDGYCYTFDIYCGKTSEATTDPLGSRVVKGLLSRAPINPKEHAVYFDNFFTNYNLLVDLKSLGYRATGTLRKNRTKQCPLISSKDMRRKSRAEYDHRFDKTNEILMVRWKDNNVCTIGTNFDTVEPLGKVKRWCSTRKQKVDVDIPHVFQSYNKGMGGVDQMDQSLSLYRIAIKGKKWWWVLFTYVVDMSISNAWRLYCIANPDDRMDQLSFRRHIARSYLSEKKNNKTRQSSSRIDGEERNNNGHNPQKIPSQLRCIICSNRVKTSCEKCLKTLCMERGCFAKYHS